jgi:anti-anti-sigma regulatory factor
MRWPLARRKLAKHAQPRDAVVVSVTRALNRQTALDLARQVDRAEPGAPVVIDLTGIPAFDSEGADTLMALQAARGADRLSIVGFRQAAARLVGPPDDGPGDEGTSTTHQSEAWAMRRLRNLVVVQPVDDRLPNSEHLDDAVAAAATDTEAAIIVVDLRGLAQVSTEAVEAIAFASSGAALRGQELLVVNVCADVAETLRLAGLSATTFVAPEPPLGSSAY